MLYAPNDLKYLQIAWNISLFKPIFAQQVLTFCLKFHEPAFGKTDNGNIYPPQIIFYFNIWQMWNCLIFNSLYWHIEYLAQ